MTEVEARICSSSLASRSQTRQRQWPNRSFQIPVAPVEEERALLPSAVATEPRLT